MDSIFVALKSVQDNTNSIQYYSLVIALVAVFFGPLLSYLIAKITLRSQSALQIALTEKNVKAQVLSKNRQDWINTLRDSLSEFIALVFVIAEKHRLKQNYNDKIERLFIIRSKISLLINPSESDHQKLDSLLDEYIEFIIASTKKEKHLRSFADIRVDIIEQSQKILKREWERVKKVE